jgi:diguanylate cyclase (GGDEF)-like protein
MNSLVSPAATILIVDDDAGSVKILRSILKAEGEILFASDGTTALSMVRDHHPDLVLLDAEMPGLDGYDVCRQLKANDQTKDTAVIFVTSHGDLAHETWALEIGAVDFITKPINPPVVEARVRTHIRLKQQADQLRRLASLDGLTGLANRRVFDETLIKEMKRAVRYQTPLSLVLLDIDFFKLYNDHYGHLQGDVCLKAVARVLAGQSRRPGDTVARYGGEEFVAILPETDAAGVAHFADMLLQAVRSMQEPHAASHVAPHVTVSIGTAVLDPVRDDAPEKLIARADAALYRAKQGGRNRVAGAE